MSKPANRCGCTHTHTHTHTHHIFLLKKKLAEVAEVCLSYSKIAYNFVCSFACEIVNKDRNKNKYIYYKYKKIGVV